MSLGIDALGVGVASEHCAELGEALFAQNAHADEQRSEFEEEGRVRTSSCLPASSSSASTFDNAFARCLSVVGIRRGRCTTGERRDRTTVAMPSDAECAARHAENIVSLPTVRSVDVAAPRRPLLQVVRQSVDIALGVNHYRYVIRSVCGEDRRFEPRCPQDRRGIARRCDERDRFVDWIVRSPVCRGHECLLRLSTKRGVDTIIFVSSFIAISARRPTQWCRWWPAIRLKPRERSRRVWRGLEPPVSNLRGNSLRLLSASEAGFVPCRDGEPDVQG